MNLQSYEHGLVMRIITYDVSIFIYSPISSSTQNWGPQWIFLGSFSIIYFLVFLLTVLTNSAAGIFSTSSSNCKVKFKPLTRKTLNMNLFSSGSGLGFFLGSSPRYPSLMLLFLLVEYSAILDTRNNKLQREYCVILSQCFPTLRICKNLCMQCDFVSLYRECCGQGRCLTN